MKKISLVTVFGFLAFFNSNAQTAKSETPAISFAKVDASSLDVVYYPLNTTKAKEAVDPIIRVLYSRPQKKGREIFGVLEPFDKIWRVGANESTEIQFFKTVHIGNKKIKAGRYSLFAIPTKGNWTVIINSQTDKWGAFSYNQAKDVVRTTVPVVKLDKTVDAFSITFSETAEGANLIMAWDNTQTLLPIVFKK